MRSIAQLCDDSIQLQEQEVKYIVHESIAQLCDMRSIAQLCDDSIQLNAYNI